MKLFRTSVGVALTAALLILPGCSRQPEPAKQAAEEAQPPAEQPPAAPEQAPPEPAKPAESAKKAALPGKAPDVYQVKLATTKGDVVIEVHKDWAPIGAQRFYDLVKSGYYDGARFFRIVPNFVVQFGIAGDPAVTRRWDRKIKDDPVTHTNRLGSVTFATAGAETRTTQVFINLRSNQFLDSQGFAPFGQVIEGMDVVQSFYSDYGENPDQDQITRRGNAYLTANFPNLDYIKNAAVISQ